MHVKVHNTYLLNTSNVLNENNTILLLKQFYSGIYMQPKAL